MEPFSSQAVLATMLGVYTLLVQGNINWPIRENWKIKCPLIPSPMGARCSKKFQLWSERGWGLLKPVQPWLHVILNLVHFRWWSFTLKKWTSTAFGISVEPKPGEIYTPMNRRPCHSLVEWGTQEEHTESHQKGRRLCSPTCRRDARYKMQLKYISQVLTRQQEIGYPSKFQLTSLIYSKQ